jgi:sporulation protein YlmC with PRC-barrel domain
MRKLALAGAALVLLAPLAYAEAAQSDAQHQGLRANLDEMLKSSGYSDIRIASEAYVVHARDADGNSVIMSISPDSFAEVKTIGMTSLSSGHAGSSAPDKYVTVPKSDELSSKIVGLDIYNNSNQDIGQIKDIALDPQGQAVAYVVSVGGFLGVDQHYVAVRPSAVDISYNASTKKWQATMNATASRLKAAPEFRYSGRWSSSLI